MFITGSQFIEKKVLNSKKTKKKLKALNKFSSKSRNVFCSFLQNPKLPSIWKERTPL